MNMTEAVRALVIDLRAMDAEGAIDLAAWPAATDLVDAANGAGEETIQLIAKVLAWQDGADPSQIPAIAADTDYQDAAQQCFEDITGLA